jgi:RNA polymerase II subunit A-like phosphatase
MYCYLMKTLLNATASATYAKEKMRGIRELIMTDNGRSHRYFVKLRPKLQYFLQELSPLYQMSIYTHGTRKYAEGTCRIMDPEGTYFGRRIVSRSDHPELGANKSLAHLLKTDWSMVLIYDDREDVWKGQQADHLLCAKPFVHFDQQSVVNNAPGMLSLGTKAKELISRTTSDDGAATSSTTKPKLTEQAVGTENVESTSGLTDDDSDGEDEGLVQAVAVFKKLHQLYFDSVPDGISKVSVGTVLRDFRNTILAGCVVCFSGMKIPTTDSSSRRGPEDHFLWKTAVKLGAVVQAAVTGETTHLLATSTGASKARQCLLRKDVFVIHCDWLLHCHWNVQHEAESSYFLSQEHQPDLARSKVTEGVAAATAASAALSGNNYLV